MAPSKTEKKKAKRKAKLKQEKMRKNLSIQRSQRRFLLDETIWLREMGNYPEALVVIRQVLRQDPDNEAALREMLIIGQAIRNPAVEFSALEGLDRTGRMPVFVQPVYCQLLLQRKRFQDARRVAEEGLALLPQGRIQGDQEFSDLVLDIWTQAPDEVEWCLKTGYEKTKALDEKLFGENFEL